MKSLISFIDEGAEDKTEKYKVVVLTRTPEVSENVKVFKTSERIQKEGKSAFAENRKRSLRNQVKFQF